MHTQTQPPEFLTAMRSVRAAKNVFLILVLLGLLVQIGAFIAVRWGRVIDESQRVIHLRETNEDGEADEQPAAMADSDMPAEAENGDAPADEAEQDDAADEPDKDATAAESDPGSEAAELWVITLIWALPASRFIIIASLAVLTVILMFATMLAINGRASGVSGIVSATLWSILLLAIVIPWHQALNTTVASGATFNFGELFMRSAEIYPRWGADKPTLLAQILYYVRFLAFPALALLIWVVVMLKFARGYGRMLRVALGEEGDHTASLPPAMDDEQN
jgi:hypothetical protein